MYIVHSINPFCHVIVERFTYLNEKYEELVGSE